MASTAVARPTRPENISSLQCKSDGLQKALERYFMPAEVVVSPTRSQLSLPLVDLTGLHGGDPAAREEIVRNVGKAATARGLFQVINHGLSEENLGELQRIVRDFFQMPVEVKERGEQPGFLFGYDGRFGHRDSEAPWVEYIAQHFRPKPDAEGLINQIWPEGNPKFCNLIREFCEGSEKLSLQLLELLAESLGLKPDSLTKDLKDTGNLLASWRFLHYPPCPEASRCIGIPAHSDTGIITILKQDNVGGLQVRVGGEYIDVKPVPGALVVNVGDTFEAWSNGRIESCEHRVLANSEADRYSMVYLFQRGHPDSSIECPPALVDEEHPQLYRRFKYDEYRANTERLYKLGIVSKQETLAFFALHDNDQAGDSAP